MADETERRRSVKKAEGAGRTIGKRANARVEAAAAVRKQVSEVLRICCLTHTCGRKPTRRAGDPAPRGARWQLVNAKRRRNDESDAPRGAVPTGADVAALVAQCKSGSCSCLPPHPQPAPDAQPGWVPSPRLTA
jgi:hypothetical protein